MEVLAGALGARGVQQGVLAVVRLHHLHLVHAAPVCGPTRRPQSGPQASGLRRGCPLRVGCLPCPSRLRQLASPPPPHFLPAQPVDSARWGPGSPHQKSWGPAHTQTQKIRGSWCRHHPFGWPGRGKAAQWGSHHWEGVRTPHVLVALGACPSSREGPAKDLPPRCREGPGRRRPLSGQRFPTPEPVALDPGTLVAGHRPAHPPGVVAQSGTQASQEGPTHAGWYSCSSRGGPRATAAESESHTGPSCGQVTFGSGPGPGGPQTAPTGRGLSAGRSLTSGR